MMTITPRFNATHHHHHHHSGGGLHRLRHPGHPIVMYSSSNTSSPTPRSESLHHHHHPHHQQPPPSLSSGYHHPHQHPVHPPPALHFHANFPQHHHHHIARPPSSSIHSHPPPLLQVSTLPPLLLKPPPLKEKTPMCLINELVRFNKVKYQYRLMDESGPSHKKNFTVCLKLGEECSEIYEEYIASGPSIKKAQHAAAALAMEETKLKHPAPKTKPQTNGSLFPTVELNTLAMKRHEQIQYELIHPYHDPKCQRKDMRRSGKKGLKNGSDPSKEGSSERKFIVNLKVGKQSFKGEGPTLKGAKHNAAFAALVFFKNAPTPSHKFELDPSSAPFVPGNPLSSKTSSDHKSPVSLVHENALKRNLLVTFRVESESGPPHMKTFVTKCTMGDFSTEGQGEDKKTSKKRSAELMLEKLKTLPPLANCSVSKRSSSSNKAHKRKSMNSAKRRAKSLVKLQKPESEGPCSSDIHPISRLIQMLQAKKEKEPIYTLVEEKGRKRKLEFVMQVKVGELTALGSGPNKKSAKRDAAEHMLELLEQSSGTSSQGTKQNHGEKDLNEGEEENNSKERPPANSQQSVLLHTTGKKKSYKGDAKSNSSDNKLLLPSKNLDFLEDAGEAKVKLAKLSEIFKFSVSYTDFQKKGKCSSSSSEYLTLVSLSMKPTQVSHGSGSTPQESQEDAAKSALKFLSENGLDVPMENGGKSGEQITNARE